MNLQHLVTQPIGRDGLQLPEPHALDRAEWVRRFTARIGERLQLQPPELEHVAGAELESWPEQPGPTDLEWQDYTPEEAADENLSYWGD